MVGGLPRFQKKDSDLINGQFYTISADLAPEFTDKMAPLAARIEHQGIQSCIMGDDSWGAKRYPNVSIEP